MSMIAFDPVLPLVLIAVLAALSFLAAAVALWRGLPGWWLRLLGAGVALAALLNPSWRQEDRASLPSIALVVVDESASNRIAGRDEQVAEAMEALESRLARLGEIAPLRHRIIRVPDAGEDGTLLLGALGTAEAELATARFAGAILVTDGRNHDAYVHTLIPAPFHTLRAGTVQDRDRRIVIKTEPAFPIRGEPEGL